MKHILPIIACLCWSLSLSAQPTEGPSYEQVVSTYFGNYNPPGASFQLRFSRRPDGYYIMLLDDRMQPGSETLYYSFAEGRYLTPGASFQRPRLKNKDQATAGLKSMNPSADFLAQNHERFMLTEEGRVPYYGYRGWYKDVIDLYENTENALTAWEWHALARAYQAQSSALLNNEVGQADPADRFPLPSGRGHLTDAQVETYLEWVGKELNAYEQLRELDPDFITPIGSVNTKYSCEVMDAFLTLMRFQDEATARQVLQDDLFDDYLLQVSRNFLNSCPPNAILYTWGDGDTYSLYYLQAVEELRTDVILVNLSLIITPTYQQMLLSGPFDAKPLTTTIPDIFFDGEVVAYHRMRNFEEEPIPVAKLYETYNDPTAWQPGNLANQRNLFLPSASFRLPVPPHAPVLGSERVDSIYLIASSSVLFADDLLAIDFLLNNNWERPLCYAPTVFFARHPAWQPYLAWEGMIMRLIPRKIPDNWSSPRSGDSMPYPIRTEESYTLWMENYQMDTLTPITDFDRMPYYHSSLMGGLRLLQELALTGQTERVQQLGRQLQRFYPDSQQAWGGTWVYIARELARGGWPSEAERIAQIILDNFEADRRTDFDRENEMVILQQMRQLAAEYDMKQISDRCEAY